MLAKIGSIFTTAAPTGVSLRYLGTILGSMLTLIGIMGWLSADQVAALKNEIPGFVSSLGALLTVAITVYAVITKSSSDKAADVAKKVDAQLPPDATVIVKTPSGKPDIIVHPQ